MPSPSVLTNVAFTSASPLRLFHGKTATAMRKRSEEHTSELQSLRHLVCRLLLEKKKKKKNTIQLKKKHKQIENKNEPRTDKERKQNLEDATPKHTEQRRTRIRVSMHVLNGHTRD